MNIDSNMLARYFLGECTEWEKEAIRVWLESDEAHKKQFIRERIRFDASVVIDEIGYRLLPLPIKGKTFIWNTLKIAQQFLFLLQVAIVFLFISLASRRVRCKASMYPLVAGLLLHCLTEHLSG